MPPTAITTPVLTLGPFSINTACYGVISQNDGSYLAGITHSADDFPYATTSEWYRSTDQGLTWTQRASWTGQFGQAAGYPSNIRANIAVAQAYEPSNGSVEIFRSVDNAAHWATVYTASIAASPNGREVSVYGLQSYQRTKAIAWGELDGNKTNPAHIYALSADAGATWTPVATFDSGDYNDIGTGFGLGELGTWYLAYIKKGGINRESWLARSDDYGANWTVKVRTRNSAGALFVSLEHFAVFDNETFVVVGTDSLSPASSSPGVWWSNDGGTSLTHVSSSNIASFPTGSFTTSSQDVRRLTRDACWLSFDQQNGTPGCPYRISLDQGHTFPIVPSRSSGSWATYTIPYGLVCVTRDGHVLSMCWESSDYNDANVTFYRTTYVC